MKQSFPAPLTRQLAAQIFHRWFIRAFALFCLIGVIYAAKKHVRKGESRFAEEALPPARVLMIGDSLSVGEFGNRLRDFLRRHVGAQNVFLYASCGSSPQDWCADHETFVTHCGYRDDTPDGEHFVDFVNGRKPAAVSTPKVERLISKHRPNLVIVQLGTNWMDGITRANGPKEIEDQVIANHFVDTIFNSSREIERIIWIMPPDSSHFSKPVQRKVEMIIRNAKAHARRTVTLIRSRDFTVYHSGKTGGDGVHYNKEASAEWANHVTNELVSIIPATRRQPE
jgi:hypothetical protein